MKNIRRVAFKLYCSFLSMLLIPESIFVFVSGIFLSSAVNIATNTVNVGGLVNLPSNVFRGMGLMFISSTLFMATAVIVRPLQQKYSKVDTAQKNHIKLNEKSNPWYHTVEEHNRKYIVILPIILLCTLIVCIWSILAMLEIDVKIINWLCRFFSRGDGICV
ncbi:MAG: hypothetical protein FWE90_03025 [Defluviitaleaceae bacterium]|nr:hypothetical protein [Defluviitaleaceae bacterium]